MTSPKESQEPLRMRRVFAAPRERVWAAWTQREQLEQWMCRDVPTHDPKYAELDVRPGGRYVIGDPAAERQIHRARRVPRGAAAGETGVRLGLAARAGKAGRGSGRASPLVTVELIDRGGQTEMVFTHEGLVSRQEREATHTGWLGCFDVLGRVLEGLHV